MIEDGNQTALTFHSFYMQALLAPLVYSRGACLYVKFAPISPAVQIPVEGFGCTLRGHHA